MIVIVIIVFFVQTLISTGVLAGALLITGEEAITKESLLKCLGITVLALAIGLIPFFGLISGIIWLAALMVVFEKDFLEALLIAITCLVINFIIGFGLALLLSSLGLVETASLASQTLPT